MPQAEQPAGADVTVTDWLDVESLAADPYAAYARLREESPVAAKTAIGQIDVPKAYERFPSLRPDEQRPEAWGGWAFRGLSSGAHPECQSSAACVPRPKRWREDHRLTDIRGDTAFAGPQDQWNRNRKGMGPVFR